MRVEPTADAYDEGDRAASRPRCPPASIEAGEDPKPVGSAIGRRRACRSFLWPTSLTASLSARPACGPHRSWECRRGMDPEVCRPPLPDARTTLDPRHPHVRLSVLVARELPALRLTRPRRCIGCRRTRTPRAGSHVRQQSPKSSVWKRDTEIDRPGRSLATLAVTSAPMAGGAPRVGSWLVDCWARVFAGAVRRRTDRRPAPCPPASGPAPRHRRPCRRSAR